MCQAGRARVPRRRHLQTAPQTFTAIIDLGLLAIVLDTLVRHGRRHRRRNPQVRAITAKRQAHASSMTTRSSGCCLAAARRSAIVAAHKQASISRRGSRPRSCATGSPSPDERVAVSRTPPTLPLYAIGGQHARCSTELPPRWTAGREQAADARVDLRGHSHANSDRMRSPGSRLPRAHARCGDRVAVAAFGNGRRLRPCDLRLLEGPTPRRAERERTSEARCGGAI